MDRCFWFSEVSYSGSDLYRKMARKKTIKQPVLLDSSLNPVNEIPLSNFQAIQEQSKTINVSTESYEDRGVRYKGYSKEKKNDTTTIYNKQDTRFISCLIPSNGVQGTYTFPTSVGDSKRYYASTVHVDYDIGISPLTVIIYDKVTSNPKMKIMLEASSNHFVIPLIDCPREFSGGSILIVTDQPMSATGYLHIQFFGWEE